MTALAFLLLGGFIVLIAAISVAMEEKGKDNAQVSVHLEPVVTEYVNIDKKRSPKKKTPKKVSMKTKPPKKMDYWLNNNSKDVLLSDKDFR